MGLFGKKQTGPDLTHYAPEKYEPVIRSSICNGERVACMREKETGRLHEIMLIRSEEDLAVFCRSCGVEREKLRIVY